MNNKFLVATIATVVAIGISFYFFKNSSKKIEPTTTASIIGVWTIDSCKKSPVINPSTWYNQTDSTAYKTVEFGADSLLSIKKDTTFLKYYVSNDSLIVKAENNTQFFVIKWINDSAINLEIDSTQTVHLTKK